MSKENLIRLTKELQNIQPDLLQVLKDDPQVMAKLRKEMSPYMLMQKAAELAESLDRLLWFIYKEDVNA